MQTGIIADIKASIGAEIRKIYRLKTHVITLAITLSLLAIALGLEIAASHYGAKNPQQPGAASVASSKGVWSVFNFFCQYVNPIVLALIVAYQIGKEFEWKTFHQIQLKGQTPLTYVISKLTTFLALALATYLLHFIVVILDYGIRSAISGDSFDIPWLQIFSNFIYSLLAISMSLLLTVMMVSASMGIVLSLIYLCVLEMIIFPLLSGLTKMLDKPALSTALSFTPMKLPERFINSVVAEDPLGAVIILGVALLIPVAAAYLSYLMLDRRQIGLIR